MNSHPAILTKDNFNDFNFREKLFTDGTCADFTIQTGDGREIRAHRAILSKSSGYFDAILLGSVGIDKIEIQEPYQIMKMLVHFLYTEKAPPKFLSPVEMYLAAEKYKIPPLRKIYEKAVPESLFTVENVCLEMIKINRLLLEGIHGVSNSKSTSLVNEAGSTEGARSFSRPMDAMLKTKSKFIADHPFAFFVTFTTASSSSKKKKNSFVLFSGDYTGVY